MSSPASTLLKGVSTLLIIAALSLELWNLSVQEQLPDSLHLILKAERVALAIHGVEGLIAAYYARSQQPLLSGVAVFFTGLPGLMDLLKRPLQTRIQIAKHGQDAIAKRTKVK